MTKEPFKIPKPKSAIKSKDLISPKVGRPEKMSDRAAAGNFMTRGVTSTLRNGPDPKAEEFTVSRTVVQAPEQTKPFSRACSAEDQTTKHNYGTLTPLN